MKTWFSKGVVNLGLNIKNKNTLILCFPSASCNSTIENDLLNTAGISNFHSIQFSLPRSIGWVGGEDIRASIKRVKSQEMYFSSLIYETESTKKPSLYKEFTIEKTIFQYRPIQFFFIV